MLDFRMAQSFGEHAWDAAGPLIRRVMPQRCSFEALPFAIEARCSEVRGIFRMARGSCSAVGEAAQNANTAWEGVSSPTATIRISYATSPDGYQRFALFQVRLHKSYFTIHRCSSYSFSSDPLTRTVASGGQSPNRNRWETIRVPGFNCLSNIGRSN
jgi:hypothetical protein